MDNKKDAPEKRITMESRNISLLHVHNNKEYLINLIDYPGYVGVSSGASTAARYGSSIYHFILRHHPDAHG